MAAQQRVARRRRGLLRGSVESLEDRRLLAAVTINPNVTYQTIQGWGTAAVYPNNLVTIAQAGTIMRDAGMNVVRVTPGPDDYAYTVGGNMRTPVPISANLDDNVARFTPGGNSQTDLIQWLKTNALEPDRIKMIGALWSPPHWMKITTGRLMNWDNGGPQSGYDPIIPWGDYGHNTGAGRVNPTMWTDWARYVLSTVKVFQQRAGLPMYAFSFQNEPNVPATYNSATFAYIANDVNNPSAGFTDNHWELYGDGVQALANELASHPEITTKFFGPELSQLGGGASNPYNLPSYNAVRQNLISRGLLNVLGGWATHEYTYPADSASMWDAWYNGSAHAAQIINGTNNLGWLGPTPGIAADNKEIWQTETDGEDQTWTKDGAMGFGLKIYNAIVLGHASGYTSWNLTGYSSTDSWGVVDLDDINNPTNSYKYDAFKQFSRWIRPGAQRINAVFENGKASIGGANELDTYNGLNVAAFNHAADKRLTMVLVNMKTSSDSTTITIPAGLNVSSFQVYQTTGTQKYVQLADLTSGGGQVTLTVPASSIVTITGSYDTSVLPAPWSNVDVGAPSPAGASSYNSGTASFTLTGGGSDIWNNSDQFQFLSQSFSGNGSIVARVTGVQNTNAWAKAGVMFRDSTAANAMFADVVVTPSSGVSFQWRSSNGGSCGFTQVSGVTAPAWVKLFRSGNSFMGYYATTTGTPTSADWIQIGAAQTIAMSNAAKAGLAVTSHNNGTPCTGSFSGVAINQSPTVATAAAASPATVFGNSANLSVLGADDAGEANINYTWAVTAKPAGAADPTYSVNANNAAKNTAVTFAKPGNYTFQVTLRDAGNLTVTSSVGVTVNPAAITYTGTGAADAYYVRLAGDNLTIELGTGDGSLPPVKTINNSLVSSLTFDLLGGDDTLALINLAPATTPPITLLGGAGTQTVTIDGGAYNFASDISTTSASTSLNIINNARATLNAAQVLDNLSIEAGGKLDLKTNSIVLRAATVGSWNGSSYTGITGLVASGCNGGTWDGPGIISSQADVLSGYTTLAVATAEQSGRTGSTFGGITLSATDVLVKYTYGGDANLDGAIAGDDYFQIDSGFPAGASGWFNGDFNYDGVVNGDDYFVIDSNYPAQGPPL